MIAASDFRQRRDEAWETSLIPITSTPVLDIEVQCPSPTSCPPITRQMCRGNGVHRHRVQVTAAYPVITMTQACADDGPEAPYIIHNPTARDGRAVLVGRPDPDHETVVYLPAASKPGTWAVHMLILETRWIG